MPKLPITLLVLITWLAARQSFAFSANEHRRVSNEALRRAVEHVRKCVTGPEIAQPSATRGSPAAILNDLEAFARGELSYGDVVAAVDYVTEPGQLLNQSTDSPQSIRATLDPTAIVKPSVIRLLHATHRDNNHFQRAALASYDLWHRYALLLAGTGSVPDLYRGICFNAYAEHFLQDILAPGHYRTPRAGLHDAAAMKIHDHFNDQPHPFSLNRGFKDLSAFFRDPSIYARLESAGFLDLTGDGSLKGNPDQEEFMKAVQARSISDVLEVYFCSQGSSEGGLTSPASDPAFEWEGYKTIPGTWKIWTPKAQLAHGAYLQKAVTRAGALGLTPVCAGAAGFQALSGGGESSSRGKFDFLCIFAGQPAKGWKQGGRGLGLGFQFGIAFPEYTYINATDHSGHGLGARIYVPVTDLEMQASVGVSHRWYRASGQSFPRWAADARLEFGYGLLFLGLGAGVDHHPTVNNGFEPAFALSATITLGFPPSLIKSIIEWCSDQE